MLVWSASGRRSAPPVNTVQNSNIHSYPANRHVDWLTSAQEALDPAIIAAETLDSPALGPAASQGSPEPPVPSCSGSSSRQRVHGWS